jgi:predicted dehydrogenase
MAPIRVGIVGANPDKGWGSAVHIPVIERQPGFALTGVCTTRMETARRSAETFGAGLWFDDPADLVRHPEIDLVVVAVKAPDHYRVAMTALEAGKHIYCEWPLAATVAEAEAMTALAARKGVRAMVGLQARGAPAVRYLRDLIAADHVGRVIAVRMHCALPGGGARRSQEGLHVIDKRNGAGTLNIQGGHAIDTLQYCVGAFAGFSALLSNQFTEIEVIETGAHIAKDAPDQILMAGSTLAGAAVSVAITGGAVAGNGIAIDVFGDRGTLSLRGDGGLNFQMSELQLFAAQSPTRELAPVEIPSCYDPGIIPADQMGGQPYPGVNVPRATLVNVANLYSELGQAIRDGHDPSPSFANGLRLHQLLAAIEAASESGCARQA